MLKWIKRGLSLLSAAIIVGIGVVVFSTSSERHSPNDIKQLTAQLFEYGSIRFIHQQTNNGIDKPVARLFSKVSSGAILDKKESCLYRSIYHQMVADKQSLFSLLDSNTEIVINFAPTAANNCGGKGVAAKHDIHDLSAKKNYADIVANIASLQHSNKIARIAQINSLNKNLIDLMMHFAPSTHTIGVHHARFSLQTSSPISSHYITMINGFKAAQFAPVNSCDYWTSIDTALSAYQQIVMQVQTQIWDNSSNIERKIAGRWLSTQTLSPVINKTEKRRTRPKQCF